MALFLAMMISACKTDDPVSSGSCVTTFDCEEGFECINQKCVDPTGGGDTDTPDKDTDTPSIDDDDQASPDELTDETPDEQGDDLPSDELLDEDDASDDLLPDGTDTTPLDDGVVTDADAPSSCEGVTCGGHGTCKVAGGVATCTCYAGYQDNDHDNTCITVCEYAGLECGATAQCDDSSGIPTCVCKADYQDNDNNDTCLPTCTKAALTCTGGECDDANGTAHCVCTDTDYQDNNNDGTCNPTCAKAVADGLVCAVHATCDDSTGTAACACNDGYINLPNCTDCAANFHTDGSGNCLPDQGCQPSNADCNGHGTCSDATGMPVCTCVEGYAAPTCATCADGYQDSDTNGTCLADCTDTCGQGGLFPSHGDCVYSGGNAACVCATGWENPILINSIWPECSCDVNDTDPSFPCI